MSNNLHDLISDLRQLDAITSRINSNLTDALHRGHISATMRRTLTAIGDARHILFGAPPSWVGGTLSELASMLPPPAPPDIEPAEAAVEAVADVEPVRAVKARRR
jgi:hypothetical protein